MPPQRRGLPRVVDINPHLVCLICDGYLVDATTVIECLHSFCRTCIVRYLENSKFCPVCDVQVHETRPLLSIRSDQTLQDLVYKLVPGLYQNEMQKRREFYGEYPEAGAGLSSEERGECDPRFISAQESISLTLQHRSKDLTASETENGDENTGETKDPSTRYLSCPAAFTVGHLKKFLSLKFSLPPSCKVDVFYDEHLLNDESTLMDIAYIYSWKRAAPMKFFYSISKHPPKLVEPPPPPSPIDPQPVPCSDVTASAKSTIDDEIVIDVDTISVSESPKTEAEHQDMEVDDPVIPTSKCEEEVNIVISTSESKEEVDPVILASGNEQENELVITTSEPMEVVDATAPAVVETAKTEVTETVPTLPATKMGIEEPEVGKSNSSPIEKHTPLPIAEPTYNSVKLVSAPERNTLLSPTNGFRLKFIHDPQLNPKSQKSKKSGRKGGRSSRHKSVPVRLARLAPYPPPVPATCLTTQPLQHLPQITMGKLVPTMITTLAPTIVTTLVSTTSSTLCNASHNSNASQVASFINQPTTCNISTVANSFVSSVPKTVPESSIPSSSSTPNSLPCAHHVNGLASPSQNICKDSPSTNTKELPNSKLTVSTTCAIVVPQSMSSSIALSAPVHMISSSRHSPKSNTSISSVPLPPFVSSSLTLSDSKPATVNKPVSSLKVTHSTTSVSCSSDIIRNSETVSSSALVLSLNTSVPNLNNTLEQPSSEQMIVSVSVTNNEKSVSSFMDDTDSIFKNENVDKKSESFKLSVKNSISAEFSDNDDLGCQPDLVVDEQKMDSSDIDDDTDTALRKKITAIAEKEEDEIDVTDDTEADSGVSCTAQSEDDHSSVKCSDMGTSPVTVSSVLSAATPNTSTTSSTDDNQRHIKSNNINDVIKHLYRQHEIGRPSSSTSSSISQPKPSTSKQPAAKDDSGVLDLSTCTRKPGEVHTFRQKPVANPVLDIKHRQQAYLPAPMKQHTVCPPAPKHNSSPLLLHHLTGSGSSSSSILHNQLTRNSKSPHHSPLYSANIQPFSLSSSRPAVSSPSPVSGRATPNTYSHKLPQGTVHPAGSINFVPGMIPYASFAATNIASFANRNNIMNLQSPNRTTTSYPKDKNVNSKMSYNNNAKQTSTFTGRKSSESPHANSPNGRGTNLTCPNSASAHPRTSPSMMRMSPHHRSASPAPSPQQVTPANSLAASPLASVTTSSQSKPSVPIYKKQDNFKSYSHKFKGSSNLAVFNPDPNGYRQKIVIKKLDSQPNNHHS